MRWPILSLVAIAACRAPTASPPSEDAGAPLVVDAGQACFTAFPERIDFGEIDVGGNAFTRLRLTNVSSFLLQPTPLPIDSPFSLDSADLPPMSPGTSILLTVRFTPFDGLLHFATLEVNAEMGCSISVPLRGLGRGGLSIEPFDLNFGLLDPGESKNLEVKFSNTQRTAVVFDRVELRNGGDRSPFHLDLTAPITIPAGGTLITTVTATPTDYEESEAVLELSGPSTTADVFMRVVGGAPIANLRPSVIEVSKMDFTPGSQPKSFVERRLWLRNDATDAGSLLSALRLKSPLFSARGEDGGITDEVRLRSFFSQMMPGEEDEAIVRIEPAGPGLHRYQLVLFTNDPRNPEQQVDISVNASSLPTCTLQRPGVVTFSPAPDAGSFGAVHFFNGSPSPCVLDAVRLGSGALGYVITDGGVDQIELSPGQAHDVAISGPDAGSQLNAVLSFHVLGPNRAEEVIDLIAPP